VLSRTAASARPTSTVFGCDENETSTSTSTGVASIPTSSVSNRHALFPAALADSFGLQIQVILEDDRASGVQLVREDRQVTASDLGRREDKALQKGDRVKGFAKLLGQCGTRTVRPLARQFLVVG